MKERAMKHLNRLFIATAYLMVSHLAVANNVVPSQLIESIYPPYRTGDMHNYNGEAMVRVTGISAMDSEGNTVVLFRDKAGAMIPMVDLANIDVLINPALAEKKGEYHDLKVSLADEVLTFGTLRIDSDRLQPSLGGTVLNMQGSVNISEYEVSSSGLEF
jgi:hypothetical protein